MRFNYEPYSKSWPTKFLTSQADTLPLALRDGSSLATQFALAEAAFHNRSGGLAVCSPAVGRIKQANWEAGQWDASGYAAGTVYTDDTVDAQDAGTGDFVLDTVATNDDGFLIACDIPFNLVSVVVSQASANGTVWELSYSIATAGTGMSNNYTVITNAYVAPVFSATGEQLIWFEPPTDWAPATTASAIINRHGATVPTKYLLLIRSTTAPDTTAGLATILTLGRAFETVEGLADNGIVTTGLNSGELALPPQCDALCAACSVSNSQNAARGKYRLRG